MDIITIGSACNDIVLKPIPNTLLEQSAGGADSGDCFHHRRGRPQHRAGLRQAGNERRPYRESGG